MQKRNLERTSIAVIVSTFVTLGFILCGCSVLTIPNPEEIAKCPLGTESIKVGITKQEVEALWGKPDNISMVENKEKWPAPREMWVYNAKYGSIPVNCGYLSKTKKLYFDGVNLTEIGE